MKKKGYIIKVSFTSSERRKIKVYLKKKYALQSKYIINGGNKNKIIPCIISY